MYGLVRARTGPYYGLRIVKKCLREIPCFYGISRESKNYGISRKKVYTLGLPRDISRWPFTGNPVKQPIFPGLEEFTGHPVVKTFPVAQPARGDTNSRRCADAQRVTIKAAMQAISYKGTPSKNDPTMRASKDGSKITTKRRSDEINTR